MSARLLKIIADALPKILLSGITVTVPLTLISFAIGMILAIVVAVVRVLKIKVLSEFFRFYVWVFRGTPLIVQLFIILVSPYAVCTLREL